MFALHNCGLYCQGKPTGLLQGSDALGCCKQHEPSVDVPVTSGTWPGTAVVISNEIAGRQA